ncbi:MAG TPA: cysteine desulfurase family protein [Thermoanaerobaculia bacterium]|nr:cysteine desulfurase family protein [Thermoanaerobaculia bacterium]
MSGAYFDNNATTPLDPRVAEAMVPWLGPRFGNPSSIHRWGQAAREAIEAARCQVAELVGADALEIVFTASGTEANNLVLETIGSGARGRVVISGLEHPSVRVAAELLAVRGFEVHSVSPGADGIVPVEAMVAALGPDTRLVALMLANNELGTLQPVAEVAAACREAGIPVLCDAVQAAGKTAVEVAALGVDYLTLGAHKFHGPLGAAALWVRKGAPLSPLLVGGSQERRRRASTENVPALVGFGLACELAGRELPERERRLGALRERFEAGLGALADVVIHCRTSPRLPHTSHVAFLGLEAESLLIRLDLAGFAVSTGSACSSGVVEPSRTLTQMGIGRHEALASLRISFGLFNTEAEVDALLPVLAREVATLRQLAPVGAHA